MLPSCGKNDKTLNCICKSKITSYLLWTIVLGHLSVSLYQLILILLLLLEQQSLQEALESRSSEDNRKHLLCTFCKSNPGKNF